jgi:hypothetical protein
VRILTTEPKFSHNVPRFMIRQLQLRYYAGNYAGCLEAIKVVQAGLFFPLYEKVCEFWFFSALTHAAVLSESGERHPMTSIGRALLEGQWQTGLLWAERCAVNFADRACLVSAEVARLQGDVGSRRRGFTKRPFAWPGRMGFLQNEGSCQ